MITLYTVHNLVVGSDLVCNSEYVKLCRLSGRKCIINAKIKQEYVETER
jgi:hypothetical protein